MPPGKDAGFGPRLKELRLAAGMSRYRLAVLLDMHPNSIVKLESGEVEPRWGVVRALAEILNVTPDAFTVKAKPAPKDRRGRPRKE
jgi:transcriptional regulator with XRE-family HTH domain